MKKALAGMVCIVFLFGIGGLATAKVSHRNHEEVIITHGYKKMKCPTCKGKGVINNGSKCGLCGGRGWIYTIIPDSW